MEIGFGSTVAFILPADAKVVSKMHTKSGKGEVKRANADNKYSGIQKPFRIAVISIVEKAIIVAMS